MHLYFLSASVLPFVKKHHLRGIQADPVACRVGHWPIDPEIDSSNPTGVKCKSLHIEI